MTAPQPNYSLMKQTLQFDDGSSVELTERKYLDGLFVFVLHDYQSSAFYRSAEGVKWGYSVPRSLLEDKDKLDNEKGFPEMVPLKPRIGIKLTEPLQWFWCKQLILSKYGIIVNNRTEYLARLSKSQRDYIGNAWRGLTKSFTAFTNQRGTDNCKDYINRVNLGDDFELPILWENTCGGHTLRVNSKSIPNAQYIEVKTLKLSEYEIWKTWTYKSNWEYFTLATNSTPYKSGTVNQLSSTGPWKVDAMHYLGGADVPIPLISMNGYCFISAERVRPLGKITNKPYPYVK